MDKPELHLLACKGTATHIRLLHLRLRMDIETGGKSATTTSAYAQRPAHENLRKDIHRQTQRHARIRNIHQPSNMALNRRATQ